MKVKCSVIEDLLPLYIDEVCSEESRKIVDEHLAECEACTSKLKTQKSDINVSEDVIKENLESKKPFKKIKRYETIRFILLLIGFCLIPFLLADIAGEGIGFKAIGGKGKAEYVMSSIEKGEFYKATKYMSFSGGIYGGMNGTTYEQMPLEDARIEWAYGMKKLKDEGIEIISHTPNTIMTDDGFTSGSTVISVRYKGNIYKFDFWIAIMSGKVELGGLSIVATEHSNEPSQAIEPREPTEIEEMLIEKISRVTITYFPG